MAKRVLTGDRPTGKLHLGHFVGSLQRRLELQDDKSYDEIFVLLADDQALTDNFSNPKKIRNNLINVTLDYLSIGLDPNRVTFAVQSALPALKELTFYFLNMVTTARLERNPTVKSELELRKFEGGVPAGFFVYPVSQTADIVALDATTIPVGEEQIPMLEQAREIVQKFNSIYGECLIAPEILLPKNKSGNRLVGIDGNAKMSKSLGNCIYLSDDEETVKEIVMKKMFTDPLHINVADPGHIEGNVVFTYLDAFASDKQINTFAPEYQTLEEMKEHYRKGGLGDVKCKKVLLSVINELLSPFREKRKYWEERLSDVYDILVSHTKKACEVSSATAARAAKAMGINYFENKDLIIGEWKDWLLQK